MRIGYLECFAGISGDMFLGALVDAGVSTELLRDAVGSLHLGAELDFAHVDRSGIRSLKARVLMDGRDADAPRAHDHDHEHEHPHDNGHDHNHAHDHHDHDHKHAHDHHDQERHHSHEHDAHAHGAATHSHPHTHGRTLPAIRDIVQHAAITSGAREFALTAFELLGRAEARIHGVPLESVHFHEVGAVDAIVDIVCAAVGVDALGMDAWRCSPVHVGSGFVNCAHGRFPVPAPATAELLLGMPTYSAGIEAELVTPTGAALLRTLNPDFSADSPFIAQRIGYGAGTRNPKKFPNVLRLSIGEDGDPAGAKKETVTVLECAIDDLSPQVLAYAADQALAAGALDVMRTAVTMKKGRVGTLLTVLCRDSDAPALQQLLFRETSTLGMRVRREERVVLAREWSRSETEYGAIRIKAGKLDGTTVNAVPEYEDCRAAAESRQVPLKRVMEAATAGWHAARSKQARPEEEQTTQS